MNKTMNKTVYLTLLSAGLMLSGCGEFSNNRVAAPDPAAEPVSAEAAPVGEGTTAGPATSRLLKVARSQLGTPYRYGGNSPGKGFDCSGFTSWVYRQVGVKLPRTAAAQYRHSQRVKKAELKRGDLLFFRIDGRSVSHVAIYAGDGRFIHAPSSGKKVSFARLDNPYWTRVWVGGGRVI